MAETDKKTAAPDPLKNRPNYADPETKRQHSAWKRAFVKQGDDLVPEHRFCPVCDYVLVKVGAPPNEKMVCGWEPLHPLKKE